LLFIKEKGCASSKKVKVKSKKMELSEINIYPIKSLGGISLNEVMVEEKGLQFDRRWMLVDEKGNFLTQREFPQMAALKVSLGDDSLRVVSEDDAIEIPFAPTSNDKIAVKVWSSRFKAVSYDETTNDWFSNHLEINCKLVAMPEETRRKVNPFYAVRKFRDVVSFADGYPVLLIGEGSLADLNAKLESPIPMNRFRPNLVVKGAEAFAEDSWKKIKVGDCVFHLVKPCARCVMTTIDQQTGISDGKEPLKTLSTYRLVKRAGESKINFGQNLIADKVGAKVKIGDKIEILEAKK
jgi:uncharacterized protein